MLHIPPLLSGDSVHCQENKLPELRKTAAKPSSWSSSIILRVYERIPDVISVNVINQMKIRDAGINYIKLSIRLITF